MLTLLAGQPECLWDDALPVEVKELPDDLAALDVLLADPELLWGRDRANRSLSPAQEVVFVPHGRNRPSVSGGR